MGIGRYKRGLRKQRVKGIIMPRKEVFDQTAKGYYYYYYFWGGGLPIG